MTRKELVKSVKDYEYPETMVWIAESYAKSFAIQYLEKLRSYELGEFEVTDYSEVYKLITALQEGG